jgi:hypothetical protein
MDPRRGGAPSRCEFWSTTGLRYALALCQAATVLITYPVWRARAAPPMLPALPWFPALSVGPALLGSLGLIAWRPRAGLWAHTVVMVCAVLSDQTRLQPHTLSMLLLLWATLPDERARSVGRAHLVALWFWAGLHKLLSPTFRHETARWLLAGLLPHASARAGLIAAYAVALGELGLALLALAPRTRRVAAGCAVALHAGILIALSPLGRNINPGIWPWNVALPLAALALLPTWREGPRASLRAAPWPARVACVVLCVAPAGYYVGAVDAYLAHVLYAGETPVALFCDAEGICALEPQTRATLRALRVALPPEPRLMRAYFLRVCGPGERLVVRDPRAFARARGRGVTTLDCPP